MFYKEAAPSPVDLENRMLKVRSTMAKERKAGWFSYDQRDRSHNAAALRRLWAHYYEMSMMHEMLQRMYLAKVGLAFGVLTKARTSLGDLVEVSSSINSQATFFPKQLHMRRVMASKHKPVFQEIDAIGHLMAMREFCEAVAQEQHSSLVINIFNPAVHREHHNLIKAENRRSMFTVFVDKRFAWPQKWQPLYLKSAMTTEAKGLTMESLRFRAGTYCDSMRMLGENVKLEDDVSRNPSVNVLMAYLTEASEIAARARTWLGLLNHEIMKEVSAKNKIRMPGRQLPIIGEPKSVMYVPGVVVTLGVSPSQVRELGTINLPLVHHHLTKKNINIDVPRVILTSAPVKIEGKEGDPMLFAEGRKQLANPLNSMQAKLEAVLQQ